MHIVTYLVLGMLACAGCTSPHPTPNAARNAIDCPLLTGVWGELDTPGVFTFAADGSFRMATDAIPPNMPPTGTYKVVGPDIVMLTFHVAGTGSSPKQIEYHYLILKNGTHLLTTESGALDSIRKAQK
jgi:hypothetical protein